MNIPYKKLLLLTLCAFTVRSAVFFFSLQHEDRYCQPDTNDYHISGINLHLGKGMIRYGSPFYLFWRTPGYPWYLSHFFRWHGVTNFSIEANKNAHISALWLQIALASCIPALLFLLALILTGSLFIAWATAWITTLHPGFILASSFMLTEGIGLIFFFLFLFFFYKSFRALGAPSKSPPRNWIVNTILASMFLAITTWIRPMGEYVVVVASITLLLLSKEPIRKRILSLLIMLVTFFTLLSPWYIRNYNLTHKIFFCPMMGTYLNAFIAPRVLRDVQKRPLENTWKELQKKSAEEIRKEYIRSLGTGLSIVPEQIPMKIALPIIQRYPFYAAYEWLKEVVKSTFDLYSYQLVALVNNSFKSDPLEEFLGEKIALTLYRGSQPWFVRIIAWLEALYALLLWIGILFGLWYFLLRTALKKFAVPDHLKKLGGLYLMTGFMVGSILFMTGGFGYARLRLPAEPLLIIAALVAWLEIIKLYRKRKES